MTKQTELWLGTQASYELALEGMAKAEANPEYKAGTDYQDSILGQMYAVQDGVAVITVNGSLVDGTAGYGIYYGVTGYDDIRNAMVAGISDPTAGSIMLKISSGGGAVSGVHELAQLVARVNAIKPVVTYTGSTMASAALWFGALARQIIVAETSITGSIGIIMVHLDRSKQMADMGIKATVIRAGTDKALASPYEELSDKAKADLQSKADALYDVFLNSMADARGVTPKMADSRFGQGREFIGAEAVRVGLADKVGSYEDAFAQAQSYLKKKTTFARASAGATNNNNVQATAATTVAAVVHNAPTSQGTEMKQAMSAEQLAAIAAGVDLQASQTTEASTTGAPVVPKAEEKTTTAAETTTPAAAGAVEPSALVVVQDMLAKAQADLASVRVEASASVLALAAKDAALVSLQAQTDSFIEIARASVKTMGLHFGLKSETVAAMSAPEVLAEHARLAGLFKEKFKTGGVAATGSDAESKPKAFHNTVFSAMTQSA